MAVRPLVREIRSKCPGHRILFSTLTAAGNKLCRETAGADRVIYMPLDFPRLVRRAIRKFAPACLLIVETELWPNFLSAARAGCVPTFLVNGRISDTSFPRYRLFRKFSGSLLRKFTAIIMQDKTGRNRAVALGAPAEKVFIAGSLKHDAAAALKHDADLAAAVKNRLGLDPGRRVIIGGCTHHGEEEILIEIYLDLKKSIPGLALILAPRHLERLPEIETILQNREIPFANYSELPGDSPDADTVTVIDEMGVLTDVYQAASVIFIGKSLTRSGGHNPIEPAALSKPIIFGPNMQNFAEISRTLLHNHAAIQVENSDQLKSAIKNILEDDEYAGDLGINARRTIDHHTGATAKTVQIIECHLSRK